MAGVLQEFQASLRARGDEVLGRNRKTPWHQALRTLMPTLDELPVIAPEIPVLVLWAARSEEYNWPPGSLVQAASAAGSPDWACEWLRIYSALAEAAKRSMAEGARLEPDAEARAAQLLDGARAARSAGPAAVTLRLCRPRDSGSAQSPTLRGAVIGKEGAERTIRTVSWTRNFHIVTGWAVGYDRRRRDWRLAPEDRDGT